MTNEMKMQNEIWANKETNISLFDTNKLIKKKLEKEYFQTKNKLSKS